MNYRYMILILLLKGCLNLPQNDRSTVMLSTPHVTSSKNIVIHKPLVADWLDTKRLFMKKGYDIQPLGDFELIESLPDHLMYHFNKALRDFNHKNGVPLAPPLHITPLLHDLWIEVNSHGYTAYLSLSFKIKETHHTFHSQGHIKFQTWNKQSILKAYDAVIQHCFNRLLGKI